MLDHLWLVLVCRNKSWTCPFSLQRNSFPSHYAAHISEQVGGLLVLCMRGCMPARHVLLHVFAGTALVQTRRVLAADCLACCAWV